MFKKTVASITKSFNKVVAELDTLIDEKSKENAKIQEQIGELRSKQSENTTECAQAELIKNNISKLLN